MPDIEIRNAGKTYYHNRKISRKKWVEEERALQNVNLKIASGSFTALVGPSGCGKTTLLSVVAGLEKPSEGAVFFDGSCVDDLDPRERQLSVVFQDVALYPHLNAFSNMAFPLLSKHVEKEEIRRTVYVVAERLGISFLLNRKPRQLSWGQQQRVVLGRVLCAQRPLLLLDEPFSGTDPEMRQQMVRLLHDLQKERKFTCIMATHHLEDVFSICSQLMLMDKGKMLQSGAAGELLEQPRNKRCAAFFANDPYSYLHALAVPAEKGVRIQLGSYSLLLPQYCGEELRGEEVVEVGCRSSQFQIDWNGEAEGIPASLQFSEMHPDGSVQYTFQTDGGKISAISKRDGFHYNGASAILRMCPDTVVLFHPESGTAYGYQEEQS